jgi:hypothetical protein
MPSTYKVIESKNVSSGTASVTFSSIPQTYDDLILISRPVLLAVNNENVEMTFNGDTSNNYFEETIYLQTNTRGMDYTPSLPHLRINYAGTEPFFSRINIMGYKQTTFRKAILLQKQDRAYCMLRGALWNNTSAITSITIKPSGTSQFDTGTVFTLFGIAGA